MLPGSSDDHVRLVYLVILLLGVLLFGLRGGRLGRNIRDLVFWLLLIAMAVIAYGFRDTLRGMLFPSAAVQIAPGVTELRRGPDGQFHATIEIDGHPVRFMVDTGASDIVLSRKDAAALGIDLDRLVFSGRAQTANGAVPTARVRLGEVRFGDHIDRDLPASVNGGDLDVSLLGMAYLGRFARIEILGDRLRLHR
ncbi:MAG TPA: retropepsin-like aspartic protease [Amaricoccus sp.]|uniref:retropepsin-like aspartic protease family protein n=1 Tax=Amaricoccus sp. TaxID=1872485 RepID=UPI002C963A56|nr:retropepsin-like aspartic protease [Amaricoccus sp.]HMQ94787.1 retropepsin-like aspartic protease [Amaricoccus sp.]HMR54759.1 retropepsin-like aspartic protease [Amaricoccus sp.]HMR61774.1 retropepsin-like aspartic protease [Amaricoccus sp.]HMU00538.1 retropepsin-like aspartic protease [Amaricoccus sp.]